MRKTFFIYIFLFLFLGRGWVFADEQGPAEPTACKKNLDISTLPPDTPFIKTDLSDLGDYFTCKAAVKEDIQTCNIFPDNSPQKANCQGAYKEYYVTFGKLYKNGRMSDEFLNNCLKKLNSRNACIQMADVLLSGNTDNCEKIEGITPEDIATCKDMASSNPSGAKAFFMMALRQGDPALCDQLNSSSINGGNLYSSSIAAICKGLLSKNVDGCQLNEGASRFKELYCQHLATEEAVNGTKEEK